MPEFGFIGGSYTARSTNADAERSLNLFPEKIESPTQPQRYTLYGTPGLTLLQTLATSPIRGIWTGLIENLPGSTGADLCYVVAGSKLCQVFSNNTNTVLGDVGDDASHSPVTFQVNGTQVLITSAGKAWIWDGATLAQAYYNDGYGTVNTAGTAVTWVSGSPFNKSQEGSGIVINGSYYQIASPGGFIDDAHVTLTATAGVQAAVSFRVMALGGTVNIPGAATPLVYWASGSLFTQIQAGARIVINGILGGIYTVLAVDSPTQLRVTVNFAIPLVGVSYGADAYVQAATSAFLDGYFIALPPNSKSFNFSDINDGKSWNPLDFGIKNGFPDDIASVLADHEELWLFGTETTEVWNNTGNATNPLQRIPGAFIRQGIRASFTAVSLANGVAWVGGDERGTPIAWLAEGFTPRRISTHAVETAWAGYSTITDARAFVYVESGHQFWVISFPAANATWVYDATEGFWHERGWWNGSTVDRTRYATGGYVFGILLVGDWQNGKLYQLSMSVYTDNATAIHRIRACPEPINDEDWIFHSRFRLDAENSGALNPSLDWSVDGGATFNTPRTTTSQAAGALAVYDYRRLGRSRARVWRISITASVKVALINAFTRER